MADPIQLADPTVRCSDDVLLGQRVRLAGFANLYGCAIDDDTLIGTFVEVQRQVRIGKRCKIQSHTFVCQGVIIEDEVFVGHGVMFTNDLFPWATRRDGTLKAAGEWQCRPTRVCRRAAIGSNATILAGVTIGAEALIAAGTVVTRDVPPGMLAAGNPARIVRPLEEHELQ